MLRGAEHEKVLAAEASLLDLANDVACIIKLKELVVVELEELDGHVIKDVPALFKE